jgi:tetratricopeptide (TPR) repeat protein
MIWQIWFLLLLLPSSSIGAAEEDLIKSSIEQGNIKKAIDLQREKIKEIKYEERGIATEELALLYLKDQDQENAFKNFLEALNLTLPLKHDSVVDENLYKKIFSAYLDPSRSPRDTASYLIKEFKQVNRERPDQYLLDYFLAIAYANLGKYEQFFKHFYRAYQFYPNHYLSYKTKAVLHIKLLERTREENDRTVQRHSVIDNLQQALELEALDTSIYKLLISFASAEKKQAQVQQCLNKIINGNIMIPRSELMFYVIEAADINESELAHRFIMKAKDWYPQSRIIEAAQNYLKRFQGD